MGGAEGVWRGQLCVQRKASPQTELWEAVATAAVVVAAAREVDGPGRASGGGRWRRQCERPAFAQRFCECGCEMGKYIGRRHVQDFLLGGAATYGALWLAVESISAFFVALKPEGLGWYGALLAVASLGGVWRAWPIQRIEFPIPGSDSSCEIRFGNIFEGPGVIVIPVNEYFDGELGDHVSETSLHGRLIKDVLAGQSKTFVDLASQALEGVTPEESGVERSSGSRDRYAIGTVARVDLNDQRYLLAALSRTDLSSLKASATVQDLWTCLAGVWRGVREYSNGRPVRIPLIGSGLSGTGLPPGNLVETIVTSYLYCTKERKVADKVTLVLPRRLATSLDLNSIKRSWT